MVSHNHYEQYDPEGINYDWSADGLEPTGLIYQIPSYSLIDIHAFYDLGDMLPVPVSIGFHLLNATDTEYWTSRRMGDGGFYGSGTRYNVSLNVGL